MDHPERLQRIVQGLVSARRSGQAWQVADLSADLSLDDAYAVQAAVAREMGWFAERPMAWKVGGSPVVTAAPLPRVWPSPAEWDGAAAGWGEAGADEVLVEAELAFRLATTPLFPEDIRSCLGTVCVAVEVIGTRLAKGLGAPAGWKLADQGVHGGLLIGPETPYAACAGFTDEDRRQQACQLSVNGEVRQQQRGGHPTVNPLSALPWLVGHAARHTGGLRAGDLITTGAWSVLPVKRGDRVEVAFEGWGGVTLQGAPQ